MKTSSKIFAVLFGLHCTITTGAAFCGYTHQWVMAVASGVMAVALLSEVLHKEKTNISPLK